MWFSIFLSYFIPFWMSVLFSFLLLALPLKAIELSATSLELGYIGAIGGVSYIIFVGFGGRFADRANKSLQASFASFVFGSSVLLLVLIEHLKLIYLIVAIYSIGLAFFWPPMEARLVSLSRKANLLKSTGYYNISWSSGMTIGPFIAGFVYKISPVLPYITAGAGAFLIPLLFLIESIYKTKENPELISNSTSHYFDTEKESEKTPLVLLYIAWCANIASWFALGILRNIFPKLSVELNYSSAQLGILFFALSFSQCALFFVQFIWPSLAKWLWFLFLGQFLEIFGLLLIIPVDNFFLMFIAFILVGAGTGITYFASLYYSLKIDPKTAGTKSGLHEFFLGAGALAGPLAGGIIAKYFNIRSPYFLASALIILAIIVEISLIGQKRR